MGRRADDEEGAYADYCRTAGRFFRDGTNSRLVRLPGCRRKNVDNKAKLTFVSDDSPCSTTAANDSASLSLTPASSSITSPTLAMREEKRAVGELLQQQRPDN